MAPVTGQDFNEVKLRSVDFHREAVSSICSLFSVKPTDIFAVCRLGISSGDYANISTAAIIQNAIHNHEFAISPDLTVTVETVAELLDTPVERLLMVSYETNRGTKTSNTVVILETSPDGTQQLRFIDLYDRFESPRLDEQQETLFHLNIARVEYLGDSLLACHHTMIISDVGIFDNKEKHTEGADHTQQYSNNVSLYGRTTPNLQTDLISQETIFTFFSKSTRKMP
jgi:hypothetical protein